jgi:Fic family protein
VSLFINIPAPAWGSNLVGTILDLEKLRTYQLRSRGVPPYIFFQLREIFQIMETLGSARIEGNNTTLTEYVERLIEKNETKDERRQELENIERAMAFIDGNTDKKTNINRAYISELHKILMTGLTPPQAGEGSLYPGELRKHDVAIQNTSHRPTSASVLQERFDDFVSFINEPLTQQNQLLMVAIAHHRFMHIHPFDNGNGRLGRLLNYAFLIKLGFNVSRILNPSSVFYTDRDKYYDMLGVADSLKDSDILAWSEYFLLGLKNQIEKIDSLTQGDFTREKILMPTLKIALEREQITSQEYSILAYLVKSDDMAIKSSELDRFGIKGSQKKSYVMQKLRDKNMVRPTKEGGRIYTIYFANNYLLRGVIQTLEENGFVADFLNQKGA